MSYEARNTKRSLNRRIRRWREAGAFQAGGVLEELTRRLATLGRRSRMQAFDGLDAPADLYQMSGPLAVSFAPKEWVEMQYNGSVEGPAWHDLALSAEEAAIGEAFSRAWLKLPDPVAAPEPAAEPEPSPETPELVELRCIHESLVAMTRELRMTRELLERVWGEPPPKEVE